MTMRGLCFVLAVVAAVKEGAVATEESIASQGPSQESGEGPESEPLSLPLQQEDSVADADDALLDTPLEKLSEEQLQQLKILFPEIYDDEPEVNCKDSDQLNAGVQKRIDEDKAAERIKANVINSTCDDTEKAMRQVRSSNPLPPLYVTRIMPTVNLSKDEIAEMLWNGKKESHISSKLKALLDMEGLLLTFGCDSDENGALCTFSLPKEDQDPEKYDAALSKMKELDEQARKEEEAAEARRKAQAQKKAAESQSQEETAPVSMESVGSQ